MFPHIRSSPIAATIHQRAREQGAVALQSIGAILTEKVQPASQISINPAIVMRSNLDFVYPQDTSAAGDLVP